MEISKKIYIKGTDPLIRLQNLQKIADELYNGNFSAMANDAINQIHNLDPMTGERLSKGFMVADKPLPPKKHTPK